MQQDRDLPKAYEPGQVEDRVYEFWFKKGYFTPRIDRGRKPFTVIMPPPNVTGELHLGHALPATIEDIMVRWHRMKGEVTLWLPGFDHAGIATQVVIERQLAAEGLTKHSLGREKFEQKAWEWARRCQETFMKQHGKLGASCDWTRERFTLDDGPSRAVATTFVRLYHKGLIYQGERITNWCPRCQTALSDLETEHREVAGHLYYINYPVVGQPDHITVATTRPETMFGDTAVAVNPHDQRFTRLIGKQVAIPVIARPIPVIADEAVDSAFGTGALKVTPAHDPVDFEMAQRRNLPAVNILNADGTLNGEAGPYQGFDRFACRRDLLARLEREGLLPKTIAHMQSVGHCARCDTIVEPWATRQWFVRTQPLAQPAIDAVKDGRITIIPEQFTKVYLHWMENIRDWCISRQLWWGHRIPVWYCGDCSQLTVTVAPPPVCGHCGSSRLRQDPDVLDTWFSSALWTHSTLGWPDETEDLSYFYPTTVMETGYDILFFWVARMIMMGIENTGDVPFRWVYLHGLLRDEKGEKMSKVKGNVINPLAAIEDYGADALRFAITTGNAPGNDVQVSSQKLEAARNFANKLWNAARFVIRSLPPQLVDTRLQPVLPVEDRWILSRLDRLAVKTDQLLRDFRFGEAEMQVHDFLWGEFCDWYVELAKIRLREGSQPSPAPVLAQTLEISLRLAHPFMPFVTEEIWQTLSGHLRWDGARPDSIMIAPYPGGRGCIDDGAEEEMALVIEIIRSIRNARAESKVEASRWIAAQVYARDRSAVEAHRGAIEALARVQPLTVMDRRREGQNPEGSAVLVLRDAEVVLPMMIDPDAERRRLEGERQALGARTADLRARLAREAFVSKAPPAVVEKERHRLREAEDRLHKIEERLAQLP
ncbi:MAG: valine--tRNA ligase [Chloroflexi bacterium]|nr:valine--tRNA ligase [Chloroflexota bacterium]